MEEREERLIQIMGLVLSVISIIIGSTFILFFIGVSRVDAYTSAKSNIWVNGQRCITNDWNGIGTLSCINNNYQNYTLRTDTYLNMTAGKKYTFYWKAQVTMHMKYSSGTSNIDNMYVSYNRNGTLGDITSCSSNYSRTNSGNDKIYNITVSCTDVQFSTTTDAITVRVYFDNNGLLTSPGMVAKLTQIYLEETGTDNSDVTNAIDNSTTSIINNNNNNTNSIINNNNSNTNSIINNNNENTQDIIDNQNANSQAEIDSQKVCRIIDSSYIKEQNSYLGSSGNVGSTNGYGVTDYIDIQGATIKVKATNPTSWVNACFYDENKTKISCITVNNLNGELTIPTNAKYFRSTIYVSGNTPQFEICKNGNQAIGNLMEDIMTMNNWEEEDPDANSQDNLEDAESDLDDYLVDDSDIESLDYGIDVDSSTAIWGIFNDVFTGNQIVYTGGLTVLFMGLIKLLLAR